MRITVNLLVLALAACSGEGERQREQAPPAAAIELSPAAGEMPLQSAAMMAIPTEPGALKRLQAMGYTIHEEEGHLHAPGVKGCPAMADGPVM